jgi:hypothetical protein
MIDVTPEEKAVFDSAETERGLRSPASRWTLADEWLHCRPGRMLRRFGQSFLDVLHYRTLSAHSPVGRKQALALYPALEPRRN